MVETLSLPVKTGTLLITESISNEIGGCEVVARSVDSLTGDGCTYTSALDTRLHIEESSFPASLFLYGNSAVRRGLGC